MTALALTRRKTQLNVLAQACQERRWAHVAPASGAAARRDQAQVRFLALERDGLLLQWPPQGTGAIAPRDTLVDVSFHHDGRVLGFRTQSRGLVPNPATTAPAWRLAVPLCVERRDRRQHGRFSLAGSAPIPVCCTSVADGQRMFTAQLHNFSRGGVRAGAPRAVADWVQPGDLLWARFALPGQPQPLEFVVRVVHLQPSADNERLVLGCRFCPADDPRQRDRQLDEARRCLIQFHAAARAGGGI
jgi:hypothetical protein